MVLWLIVWYGKLKLYFGKYNKIMTVELDDFILYKMVMIIVNFRRLVVV